MSKVYCFLTHTVHKTPDFCATITTETIA